MDSVNILELNVISCRTICKTLPQYTRTFDTSSLAVDPISLRRHCNYM